jgi:cytochrome c-type biogenesis protein CcmH/NrfG
MEQLLATQPSSARGHSGLADFARQAGDFEWAADQYRIALAIEPDRRDTANNLAWILAVAPDPKLRDPEESIRLAQRALRGLDPPNANYLDTLATGYASAGRLDEAIAAASRGVRVATEAGEPELADELRARLDDYRSRRADPAAPDGAADGASSEPAAPRS